MGTEAFRLCPEHSLCYVMLFASL